MAIKTKIFLVIFLIAFVSFCSLFVFTHHVTEADNSPSLQCIADVNEKYQKMHTYYISSIFESALSTMLSALSKLGINAPLSQNQFLQWLDEDHVTMLQICQEYPNSAS